MCDTDDIMAKKPINKPTNGGRATLRDVMSAVIGLNDRIDDTHTRIDAGVAVQQRLSEQMTELHDSMCDLRKTTNERLHGMDAEIIAFKRPWALLASGWTKAVAFGGVAAALSSTAVRLELWRFIPGL